MATFNVVVSDPETGQSYTREVEGQAANRFMGREIGEAVDGGAVGLDGFTVEITGGSDDAGRPMRPDVRGPALKEILLEGGVGYEPNRDGERKRVTVRGREVSESIAQLNVKVTEGEGSVAVALGEAEPEEVEEADESEADDEAAEDEEPADAEAAEEDETEEEADEEEAAEEEAEEEEAEEEEESDEEAAEEEADDEADEEEADDDAEEEDGEAEADDDAEEEDVEAEADDDAEEEVAEAEADDEEAAEDDEE